MVGLETIISPSSVIVSYSLNVVDAAIVPPQSPFNKHILSFKDKDKVIPLELCEKEGLKQT